MNILFLGAAKRLSLLEAFIRAGESLNTPLHLFSIEKEKTVPIATVATILECPHPFKSKDFLCYLSDVVRDNHIELCIPLMDSATVALSMVKDSLDLMGCHAVVSSYDLCRTMEDKVEAEEWFFEHGIPTPDASKGWPVIAKSRMGFGSRDQAVLHNMEEYTGFFSRRHGDNYYVQAYIEGQEYTCDCYVDRQGEILSVLTRKRLEIEAGEVMSSITQHNPPIEAVCRKILKEPGFEGPVNIQVIDSADGPVVVEANPRHGGGCLLGIHCGQNYPLWIIQEHLGLPITVPEWESGVLMTRARRDIFFDVHNMHTLA
jgi:carbamoyl-phosphate synthase large subunit